MNKYQAATSKWAARKEREAMLIRAKIGNVKRALAGPSGEIHTDGRENITPSGAKVYHRGKGWWRVHGYAFNNSDALATANLIVCE